MFITPAYAQTGGGGADLFGFLFPMIAIMVIFYFLLIRPQNQRMKQHQQMVEGVRRGDTVVTSGGIVGKITRVADDELTVEIADGVRVRVVKNTLSDVRSKNEPVSDQDKKGSSKD